MNYLHLVYVIENRTVVYAESRRRVPAFLAEAICWLCPWLDYWNGKD